MTPMDFNQLLTGVIGFAIGFPAGWLAKSVAASVAQQNKGIHAEDIVMAVIALAWFLSVLAGIMSPDLYKTPLEVHAIMGLLAGYLYKTRIAREQGDAK